MSAQKTAVQFTTQPTDKLPPQNLEAESSVIGSLLLEQDAVVQVADILSETDFTFRRTARSSPRSGAL